MPVENTPAVNSFPTIYAGAVQDYQGNRIDKAIATLNRLADKPENTTGIGNAMLSEIYREACLNLQAEFRMNKALAINPSDPYSLVLKGEQLWASGDFSGADGYFAQAVESPVGDSPDRARALNSRGVLAFLNGNVLSAQLFFEAALQIHPMDTDAPLNLAYLSYSQNDYSAANNYLEPVLKQFPEDATANEMKVLLAPVSAFDPQIADHFPDILIIPPILSHGRLNRLGMDKILSEKMTTLLTGQYSKKRIKQTLPVYGQYYSKWRLNMDGGWLPPDLSDGGGAQQIIWGVFGQTLHTITMTIKWFRTDSGQVILSQTFHGKGPDKLNMLLNDLAQALPSSI